MEFRNFDIDGFLREYWQRKPLLIRNPWVHWQNPLSPGDLAQLASEEGVEARLVEQPGADITRGGQSDRPRSLLVQAVDHFVPEVASLIAPFRFVPNWRIDDVMVSHASDGGGVGAHFDQYDVFLVQGLGKRRWQIGQTCNSATALLPHDDLRLLANFEIEDEWILEPGDILYVPPRIAHNGIAIGNDCMTYSVGFRAPAQSELIAHFCDSVLASLNDDCRYVDKGLNAQDNPGEITAAALSGLHALVTERMSDRNDFARWFGEYTSTRKYPDIDWQPEEPIEIADLHTGLADGLQVNRNPASRFSFMRQSRDALLLFVDGQSFECTSETADLAQMICARDCVSIDGKVRGSQAALSLLTQLYNQGSISFEIAE